MAYHLAVTLVGSGVLNCRNATLRSKGARIDHDPSAPSPEWMQSNLVGETHVAGVRTGLADEEVHVSAVTAQYSSWQYNVTPDMIGTKGLNVGPWVAIIDEVECVGDDYDEYEEPYSEVPPVNAHASHSTNARFCERWLAHV